MPKLSVFDAVELLIEKFSLLKNAINQLQSCLINDNLPVIIPTLSDHAKMRLVAIDSFSNIWFDDGRDCNFIPGIACASAESILAANRLNDVKSEFKDLIQQIRIEHSAKKKRLDSLHEITADENLALLIKRADIQRMNLLRCYAKVQILPTQTESVSWTWATRHSAIQRVRLDDALVMAKEIPVEKTREAVLDDLSRLAPGQTLAFKKNLPNALRANLLCGTGDSHYRKMINVSGVLLNPADHLPRWKWRDDPIDHSRRTRSDKIIDAEVYIKRLNLHLYKVMPPDLRELWI